MGTPQRAEPDASHSMVAQELETSMVRANDMLLRLAFGGTTSGSASANSVYLDVLTRLGMPGQSGSKGPGDVAKKLSKQLKALGERSEEFEELGLVPEFAANEFADALKALPSDRAPIAEEVLGPFLSSLTARLDALQDAQTLIRTFLDQGNKFLTGKRLTFDQRRGVMVALEDGGWLDAGSLSSGERQLVLLLCNALLARQGTRLFLIDEPELSLNAKWQRRIVPALLALTEGAPVQFLIATHSIEVLAGYRPNIVHLEEVADEE